MYHYGKSASMSIPLRRIVVHNYSAALASAFDAKFPIFLTEWCKGSSAQILQAKAKDAPCLTLYRLLFLLFNLSCTAVDIGDLLRRWKPQVPDETHSQASIEGALGEGIRTKANQ